MKPSQRVALALAYLDSRQPVGGNPIVMRESLRLSLQAGHETASDPADLRGTLHVEDAEHSAISRSLGELQHIPVGIHLDKSCSITSLGLLQEHSAARVPLQRVLDLMTSHVRPGHTSYTASERDSRGVLKTSYRAIGPREVRRTRTGYASGHASRPPTIESSEAVLGLDVENWFESLRAHEVVLVERAGNPPTRMDARLRVRRLEPGRTARPRANLQWLAPGERVPD